MTIGVGTYLQFALALVFVLTLIGALAFVARRVGLGHSPRSAGRRLGVTEMLTIDPKRRLVLVRCDALEHLILLGATSETVLDRGIPRAAMEFAAAVRNAIGEPSPGIKASGAEATK